MAILIEGMEMPKNCYTCPFCDYASARCDAIRGTPYTPEDRYDQRADWCPLRPAPEWISVERDEYKRAESEGRLIVLPCKVGDTVYRLSTVRGEKQTHLCYSGEYVIQEFGITHEYVNGNGLDMFAHMILDDGKTSTGYEVFSSSNIGKTVFLTREEAEAALKEGKHEKS